MLAQKQRPSERESGEREKLDTLLRMLLAGWLSVFFFTFFIDQKIPKLCFINEGLEGVVSQSSPWAISLVPFSFSLLFASRFFFRTAQQQSDKLNTLCSRATSFLLHSTAIKRMTRLTCRLTLMEFAFTSLTSERDCGAEIDCKHSKPQQGAKVGNLKKNSGKLSNRMYQGEDDKVFLFFALLRLRYLIVGKFSHAPESTFRPTWGNVPNMRLIIYQEDLI